MYFSLQQANSGTFLMVMAEVEEWKQKQSKCFFRVLYGLHLLISHWPKKLTWPNSESRGKEIDPTCLVRETIKSHGKEAWIQGETGAIYAINLLHHGKKLTDMYNRPE